MLRIIKFSKDFLLRVPLTMVFRPFSRVFEFVAYFNKLIIWIYKNKASMDKTDFWSPMREYAKRETMYDYVNKKYGFENKAISYLEFGVSTGTSFRWWLANAKHADSTFYGFDTFEGLPEDWGTYKKGDMASKMPDVGGDNRVQFIAGLFQDTLNEFILKHKLRLELPMPKIIHLDADLYTATIFTLSQLYPFMHKGDIIIFDEFSVATHEFKAYDEFVSSFNIKLQPIMTTNNFCQISFEVV
jgi:O-methyltransferase